MIITFHFMPIFLHITITNIATNNETNNNIAINKKHFFA